MELGKNIKRTKELEKVLRETTALLDTTVKAKTQLENQLNAAEKVFFSCLRT